MATRKRQPEIQLPGTPKTANDALLDAMLRHQIGLIRLSGSLGRKIKEILDATERDMRNAIRRRLRKQVGLETPAQVLRLQALLREIRKIRGKSHAQVTALYQKEMLALAIAEPKTFDAILKTVSPTILSTKLPDTSLLRSIVTTRPFEGMVMREWSRSLARNDLLRIESQIRIGLVQGESIPEISRRVVGSVRLKGRDGVTALTRRNAEAIARTAVNAIANQARRVYFLANAQFFEDELYVATLDARTTPICRSLDGQRFPIGEGPIPPLHFNCRSVRVPVLDESAIGKRPFKAITQRQLLREFAAQQGLAKVPSRRALLPRGTKGPFDKFARQRVRDFVGRVSAKVDYQTWLGRQSAMFQDDVLGKAKGRLFRRGGLTLDKFVDTSFAERTLADLAQTEKQAFIAAGLDPEAFL